jgi:predicted acyltransferase
MDIRSLSREKAIFIGASLIAAGILVVGIAFISSAQSEWSKTVFMDAATTGVNLLATLALLAAALVSRQRSRQLMIAWLTLALAHYYTLGDATDGPEVFLHQNLSWQTRLYRLLSLVFVLCCQHTA